MKRSQKKPPPTPKVKDVVEDEASGSLLKKSDGPLIFDDAQRIPQAPFSFKEGNKSPLREKGKSIENDRQLLYDRKVINEKLFSISKLLTDEQLKDLFDAACALEDGRYVYVQPRDWRTILLEEIAAEVSVEDSDIDQRPDGETVPEFINRVYHRWIAERRLHRGILKEVNPTAYQRLYSYERTHGKVPVDELYLMPLKDWRAAGHEPVVEVNEDVLRHAAKLQMRARRLKI